MADSRQPEAPADERTTSSGEDASPAVDDPSELSTEELRRRVEAKYDFDEFGPADMAQMSADEWAAAFDPETWITGVELLDRLERELRANISRREVFAVVERVGEGDDDRVVAYSDEGYAIVRPDGSIQGTGTILRDVEPMVALCAMEEYDVPDVADDAGLPHPDTVTQGSGELGNRMLQFIAATTALAGIALFGVWVVSLGGLVDIGFAGPILITLGLVFLFIGFVLFVTVANARLSDRMRSAQYRDRLRAVGAGSTERPEFLPDEAFEAGGRELEAAMERIHRQALESDHEESD